IEVRVAETHTAYGASQGHLRDSVLAARNQIAGALKARRAEVEVNRDAAQTRFTKQFRDHRKNVDTTVATAVSDGEKLKADAQKRVRDETTRQANEARAKGEELAAEYPNTSRGAVQKEAARAIADKTALEMHEQVPEAEAACGDVVEELPKGFREAGAKLLDGFDSGLPALLASVNEQSGNTRMGLGPQALQAQDALDAEAASVHAQLASFEMQAVAQARELRPLMTEQIDAALRAAHAQVRQGAAAAVGRIREVVDQAAVVLTGAEAPDPGSAETFTAEIEAFAGSAAVAAGELLREVSDSVGGVLGRVVSDTEVELRKVEQQATTRREDLATSVDKAIDDFVVAADEQLGASVDALTKLFDDKSTEIDTKLATVLTSLKGAFTKTLGQAGSMITKMINDALHQNDNLLFTLRVEMRRGAAEAAWEYDHPIRAAIGTALQIIGGIILGLLAVALLVVVAIVAFKVAVAGLVAIGFSTAVATGIVIVAGLALLAYGGYSAYTTRRRHGESVGMALLGAVGDVTGISEIIRGATRPHLSPFDRAYSIAHGAGTLVALILPFAKGPMGRINGVIDSFLPGAVVNPSQGAAWRALGRALGVGKNAPAFGGGLFGRGGVPDVGVLPEVGEVAPALRPAGGGGQTAPKVELPKLIEPPKVVEPPKIAEPPKAAELPKPAEPPKVSKPPSPASGSVVKPAATPEPATLPEPTAPLRLVKPRPPSPAEAANDNAIPLPKGAAPPKGAPPPPEPLPAQASKAVELVEAAEEAALAAVEVAPQKVAATGGARPAGSSRLDVRASGPSGGGPSGPVRPPVPGRSGASPGGPGPKGGGPSRPAPGGSKPPKPAEPTLPERLEAIRQQEPARAADELAALASERQPRLDALNKEITRLENRISRLSNEQPSTRDLARARIGKKIEQLTRDKKALEAKRDPLARELSQIGQDTRLNAYRLHPEWKSELPCFGAGTPVWTEDGPRSIELIKEGDRVWAFSFDQGVPVLCRVSAAIHGLTDHFYRVRVAEQTVQVTGAHLFWIEELDAWVPARDLAPGMRLRRLSGESSAVIEAVALVEQSEPQLTFNLSVDGAPSYYVGAGVLVHNTPPPTAPVRTYNFGPFTVYEGVYEGTDPILKAKYGDRIYIGQTEQPLGVREGQHRWEAAAELKKPGLTAAEREFWEFKRDMKLRPRVSGLDAAQADYFEQLNLNVEREARRIEGKGKVVYRREQAVPERFRTLAENIAKDPRVRAAGFCLR
ncbi:MAG: polymorphic toxin-type HINT domain-containing protein, partial [Actinomycetota bacterium]